MYYIKDIRTGEAFKIKTSTWKLALISMLRPTSHAIYGISIGAFFTLFGLAPNTIIVIMIAAYMVDVLFVLTGKIAPIDRIYEFLAIPIINSMFEEPHNFDRREIFTFFAYKHPIETSYLEKYIK